jgi:hypothetical protein
MADLTKTMVRALRITKRGQDRYDAATPQGRVDRGLQRGAHTSTSTGDNYVAGPTAAALERRGLIRYRFYGRSGWLSYIELTDRGERVLAELEAKTA